MLIKLKIFLKLLWKEHGDWIIHLIVLIGFFSLMCGYLVLLLYIAEVGGWVVSVLFVFITLVCPIIGLLIHESYNNRREEIEKEHQEVIRIKSEKRAKEGALSITKLQGLEGELSLANTVLNRKVK